MAHDRRLGDEGAKWVTVGRVVGLFGVQGWLRVYSFTQPKENLFGYAGWHLKTADGWRPVTLEAGAPQGKGLVAKLAGVDDRDHGRPLLDSEIAVPREVLPAPPPGEYYWIDLQGLRVNTVDGVDLGVVDHLFATGANDVMVVRGGEREHLVPWLLDEVVRRVDEREGVIEVEWDPAF